MSTYRFTAQADTLPELEQVVQDEITRVRGTAESHPGISVEWDAVPATEYEGTRTIDRRLVADVLVRLRDTRRW